MDKTWKAELGINMIVTPQTICIAYLLRLLIVLKVHKINYSLDHFDYHVQLLSDLKSGIKVNF